MTLLARVALEMLILVTAPIVVLAIGRHGWHRSHLAGHPVFAIVAFNAALMALMAPPIVRLTASSTLLLGLSQLVFLLAAMAFWWPVLRPTTRGGLSPMTKIGYLFVAGVPPTIPGVVLGFSRGLLYPGVQASGAFGLTPLEDQQLAGLLLFATAKAVLVTLTLFTLWRLLAQDGEPPDDSWDDDTIAAGPPDTPAWFRRLDQDLPQEQAGARPIGAPGADRAWVGAGQTSGQG
ncbi:MAG TPA: cytochrome c oxidase assembly protein [Candidatus Limnocylindrales bacterium]|nr:cytochrome c oxidase assembly protein [Candidatus Limnocylindrales bacterium]